MIELLSKKCIALSIIFIIFYQFLMQTWKEDWRSIDDKYTTTLHFIFFNRIFFIIITFDNAMNYKSEKYLNKQFSLHIFEAFLKGST